MSEQTPRSELRRMAAVDPVMAADRLIDLQNEVAELRAALKRSEARAADLYTDLRNAKRRLLAAPRNEIVLPAIDDLDDDTRSV